MSYFCIYQNKFINLGDKIAMLWRAGCNNDDSGRENNKYNYIQVKTRQDFLVDVFEHLQCRCDESWGMKIGNKYVNDYQYGEWLLKGIKNAMSVEDFKSKYSYRLKSLDYLEDIATGNKYYKGDTARYFNENKTCHYRLCYKDLELTDIGQADEVFIKIKRC